MTRRKKILLWLGLVVSVPAAGYAGISVIFYSWLNAAEPERWPTEKAAVWAYSALALTIVFLGLFGFCLVSIIKEANRKYREQHNAT